VYDDYAGYVTSGYPVSRLNGCGIVDYYRIPKFSYYFFQSQRDPAIVISGVNSGPMVKIANRWTTGSPATVRVFSNCAQVSLYRDNTLVATRSPDNGSGTGSLLHPPFTFALGSYSSGTLRAVGSISGAEKAWDTVKTPGSAAAVRLRPESNDPLEAGGSDARLVWIDIIDASGTVVYGSSAQVTLGVSGAGSIIGPTTVSMKGGQLATWVRSGSALGTISLTAQSSGLTSATLALNNNLTAVFPSLAPKRSIAGRNFALLIFGGNGPFLPVGFAEKAKSFSVYDISGKLVGNAVAHNHAMPIRAKSAGVYIVSEK
jgi:hypothetical protein